MVKKLLISLCVLILAIPTPIYVGMLYRYIFHDISLDDIPNNFGYFLALWMIGIVMMMVMFHIILVLYWWVTWLTKED